MLEYHGRPRNNIKNYKIIFNIIFCKIGINLNIDVTIYILKNLFLKIS